MTKPLFALAAALTICCGSVAFAQQDQSSPNRNQSGALTAGDRAGSQQHQQMQQDDEKKFIQHASSCNNFEIQFSQFVEQRSQDQQIKELAQRLAQDHQQAEQQLKQVAQTIGVNLSDQIMPAQQAMLQELQRKQGAELDRAFLFCNVGDHHAAVIAYAWAAKAAQNPQLKQYCEQTLQQLRQHTRQVDQVASAVLGVNEAQTAGERIPGESNTGNNTNRPGSSTDTNRPDSTSGGTPGSGIRSR